MRQTGWLCGTWLGLLVAVCFVAWGCATTSDTSRTAATAAPIPDTYSDEPLTADQAAGMAADDADAFRAEPAKKEPTRRPPRPRTRRAVDQPRIRP